jgi:hypothetical protein
VCEQLKVVANGSGHSIFMGTYLPVAMGTSDTASSGDVQLRMSFCTSARCHGIMKKNTSSLDEKKAAVAMQGAALMADWRQGRVCHARSRVGQL